VTGVSLVAAKPNAPGTTAAIPLREEAHLYLDLFMPREGFWAREHGLGKSLRHKTQKLRLGVGSARRSPYGPGILHAFEGSESLMKSAQEAI
jgi:hypothetical protein